MKSLSIDIVSDNVTDASKRLGVTVSVLFLRAAKNCRNGHGFSNNEEVGESFYRLWARGGYKALPPAVQIYILEVNDGEHRFSENERQQVLHGSDLH